MGSDDVFGCFSRAFVLGCFGRASERPNQSVLEVPEERPGGRVSAKGFGRFSTKSLADFRPKFWSVFGQNLGRFSTHEMFTSGFLLSHFLKIRGPVFRIRPGRFLISVWSFSDFGFQFGGQNRGRKLDKKLGRKTARGSTDCERARNLASSASNFVGRFSTKNRGRFWIRILVFGEK